jgi:hypothetical protein
VSGTGAIPYISICQALAIIIGIHKEGLRFIQLPLIFSFLLAAFFTHVLGLLTIGSALYLPATLYYTYNRLKYGD